MSEFEKTPAGQKLPGATGGIKGEKGNLFGVPLKTGNRQARIGLHKVQSPYSPRMYALAKKASQIQRKP